jgi:hypothetical protein
MLEFEITNFGSSPNPPQGIDPDAYAQQYATENGISLEEAKQRLKAKFGDPQKPNSTFVPNGSNITFEQAHGLWFNRTNRSNIDTTKPSDQITEMLRNKYGIPEYVIKDGNKAIKQYAIDNVIDLPARLLD